MPSNVALEKFGARIWIARVMITWGLVSGAMVFVSGPVSFYVLRFLLGAAEAGFFPGIILYLSYWFPARRRATVNALFVAAAPISVALGSPVSGALLGMDGLLGLHGWQWMFVLEAAPAVVMGVVTLFYLTDRPRDAAWLQPDERAWLTGVLASENAARAAAGARHSLWKGLTDIRVLTLALVYLGTSAGLYTLSIWAPQIIHSYGLGALHTGLINAIPPTLSVIAMFLWSRHSDRTGERVWHVVIACLAAAAGLVFAGLSTTLVGVVATLVIVNIGISSSKPPLWSMPTQFLSGPAAASGIAVINSIGNLGGIAGPTVIGYVRERTGSYEWGLFFVGALLMVSALLVYLISRYGRRGADGAGGKSITALIPDT